MKYRIWLETCVNDGRSLQPYVTLLFGPAVKIESRLRWLRLRLKILRRRATVRRKVFSGSSKIKEFGENPLSVNLSIKFQVDMVIVPATTGQMGVLPGHVSTIAELKPGVLSVHEGNEVTKYFVSSGFAFVHANSVTDIVAVEAVPVDRIDPSLVQKGLADFTQKLNSATTDLEKAEAQIGVDVHSALNAALSG
ncbi:hypothetical protein BHM03_00007379 [Ensete ventricosum]|nr:hypothetical protein BHM03_00007379 [Ensete ventricosum]